MGLRSGRLFEPVLPNPKMELRAGQPQSPRRFRLVTPALAQDLRDRGAFDAPQLGRVLASLAGACLQGEVARVDEPAFTENRRALEDISKLSNVAGPFVLKQCLPRIACQAGRRAAEGLADLLHERLGQRNDVGWTIPQRRNLDVEPPEPIEQILPKVAALD